MSGLMYIRNNSTKLHLDFSFWIHYSNVVFVFLVFFAVSIQAQSSGVKGAIKDKSTREAMVAATIASGTVGGITDETGHYQILLQPGKYRLDISYLGYTTEHRDIVIKSDEWIDLDVWMESAENVLQTAVISDSRYAKPISESTISMEVIKSSLIDHLNATSVDEVLDKVPGLTMVGDQANIRGGAGFSYGAGSRVLLMINEVPALQADAGYPNWDDVPVENIEQIEVIKGAASASYGSSALNGLIHVRTAYAKSDPITKASVFYSAVLPPKDRSQQWWNANPYTTGMSFSHSQKYGKLDVVGSTYLQKSKSYNETSGSEYARINGSIHYRITDRLTAGFHLNMNRRKSQSFFYWRDGVTAYFRPDSSTLSNSNSFRYHIDPFITYFDKSDNKHAFRSRIYVVDNTVSNGQSNSSTLLYGEYQFQRQFKKQGIYLTSGLVANHNSSNSDLFSRLPFKSDNLGLYLQAEKKLYDHTTVSVGWRFEDYTLHRPEVFEGDTLPGGIRKENKSLWRVGINSKINKGLYLRASWGEGFRFPTLAEQFITTSFGATFISPNPGLTSERGWNGEVGLKQGFLWKKSKGYLDAAVFWSKYTDMMEFVFTGFVKGFQSQNIGNTDIKGFEVSAAGATPIGRHLLTYTGGYTFIEPRFVEFTEEDNRRSSADFNILKYRSKHLFKLDIEDQLGPWTFGSGILYTSKMEAIDAIFELVIKGLKEFRQNHGGYTVVDLRAARSWRGVTFNLIFKNLFNEIYTSRPAQMEAPRNITFKINYNF